MACTALEEKINKIRQQNEEIRRRYEEVEEDKKNAAKLNALVQMVPSSDWPERKEPPEFSNPPRPKQRSQKDKHDNALQGHERDIKKGDGPPPDPKYNFLADSEREEGGIDYTRDNIGNRTYNKVGRNNFRKRGSPRDVTYKDNRMYKGNYREEYQPGYDAWRAERNRIDEDRISRQRTAEGNWRREWDNDKMHIVDDTKNASRSTLGDFTKKPHKDFDRRYHVNGGDYQNHNRGGHRPYRGASKNFHGGFENRSHNTYDQHKHHTIGKAPLSPDERTVIATDKNIKITLNQPNAQKGPLMGVKVNLPTIAGTGRVGPRQRVRTTYSLSDAEIPPETESVIHQKSFDDKSRSNYFNNQKTTNIKRSQSQKKKNETGSKSPYLERKYHDNEFRSAYTEKPYTLKSPASIKLAKPPSRESEKIEPLNEKHYDQIPSNEIKNAETDENNSQIVQAPTNETDHEQKTTSENSDLQEESVVLEEHISELKDKSIDVVADAITENSIETRVDSLENENPVPAESIAKETDNNENENLEINPNKSLTESNSIGIELQNVRVECDNTDVNLNEAENNTVTEANEQPKGLSEDITESTANSCDTNKNAVADSERDTDVPIDDTARSSEAETCSVIENHEHLELLRSSEESKELLDESLAPDSHKSVDDNPAEESVDASMKESDKNVESNTSSETTLVDSRNEVEQQPDNSSK